MHEQKIVVPNTGIETATFALLERRVDSYLLAQAGMFDGNE